MRKKIEIIDFLKGYSILSIVIFHIGQELALPPVLAKMINFGGTGVHAFIFVSGFGLYLSHLRQPLPFIAFLKKRFSKIYVPYIIIVLVSALISLFIPVYINSWYAFFGHALLYKMFDSDIIGSYGYQLWFISTIIQFYFLFSLIAGLKERMRDLPFMITGLTISIAWGTLIVYLGNASQRSWNGSFLLYLWEFMLGILLAERLFRTDYEFWKIKKIYLLLLSAAGIGCYALMAFTLGAYGRLLNDVPALIGYVSLSILLYRFQLRWINDFVLFIAKISYPLFLVHILILQLVLLLSKHYGISFGWMMAALTLLLCLLTSWWLEKFFNRVDRLLFAKPAPVTPHRYSS